MKSVIVGTAGHIDHGKTALVKALTGIDADRLEEEKRRGITIDIGFAHLELNGLRLGFVDVPGHERFVRNMLAGVGGIDLVLLVVAADESVKPQTREHFDICRLLNVRRGITVLNKSDLVDRETLEVVRLELEDFLRGSFLDPARAPVIPVSSKTGEGLEELKRALAQVAAEVPAKDSTAAMRLPIDRVFVMKGFGTVVTGTLVSGNLRKEDEVELFPEGRRLRVRGIQVHNAPAEQAVAGQRTALNLAGVATHELARGMMLGAPGLFRATSRADVTLNLLPSTKPLRDRARVHLHTFTAETIAEVVLYGTTALKPGESAFAQLRTREPLLLLPGDRFILRQFSPVVTIGGGAVLDAAPLPPRSKVLKRSGIKDWRDSFLQVLASGSPPSGLKVRVARRASRGLSIADAVAETGWRPEQLNSVAQALIKEGQLLRLGDVLVAVGEFEGLKLLLNNSVLRFHEANPLVRGIGKEQLREKLDLRPEVFAGALEALVRERKLDVVGEEVRTAGRGVVMKSEESESKKAIEQAFATAGLKVPALKEVLAGLKVDRARAQQIVTLLLREKVLVKISEELVFHHTALDDLRRRITEHKTRSPKIDVAQFKDLTGVSRKYAIPLLEYLDRERVTRRVGDERVIL
jgi:selenocysteine-specific elongation factor